MRLGKFLTHTKMLSSFMCNKGLLTFGRNQLYLAMDDAYTKIYPYYDTLMSFIDYPAWIKYIEKVIFKENVKDRMVFDLACGTGTCLKIWLEKGYEVKGLDSSPGMLEIANQKLNGKGELILADMRNFTLAESVPIVTCLYDSLNNLLIEEELLSCFRSVFNAMSHKGLFLFDMNTIHCLKDQWDNQTITRENGHLYSVWKNSYDNVKNISTLYITLFINRGDAYHKVEEVHRERGYHLETIRDFLKQVGFSNIEIFQHLTFLPVLDTTSRIIFKARRL